MGRVTSLEDRMHMIEKILAADTGQLKERYMSAITAAANEIALRNAAKSEASPEPTPEPTPEPEADE